jgi:hypothetical protein
MGGARASSDNYGTYGYQKVPGENKIGNWNTGGGTVGFGNPGSGVRLPNGSIIGRMDGFSPAGDMSFLGGKGGGRRMGVPDNRRRMGGTPRPSGVRPGFRDPQTGLYPDETITGLEPEFDPNAWQEPLPTVDGITRNWREMMERTAAWRNQKAPGWNGVLSGPQVSSLPPGGKQFYDRVPQETSRPYGTPAPAGVAPPSGYQTNPFTMDGRGVRGMRDTYRASLSNRNTY